MEHKNVLDIDVVTWEQIKRDINHSDILLGNGFSAAHGMKCSYEELYEAANFPADIKAFFSSEDNFSFESAMNRASNCNAPAEKVDLIRETLNLLVLERHPYRGNEQIAATTEFISHFRCVFTTNFDLLLYWIAAQEKIFNGFTKEGCKYTEFVDPIKGTKPPWPRKTGARHHKSNKDQRAILWLHGGYHLYRVYKTKPGKRTGDPSITYDVTRKIRGVNANLVDFVKTRRNQKILSVVGANAEDKRSTIAGSAYLKFCHDVLREVPEKLVTFGFGFDSSDNHILEAIRDSPCRELYVGLYRGTDSDWTASAKIIQRTEHLRRCRGGERPLKVVYYDTATVKLR